MGILSPFIDEALVVTRRLLWVADLTRTVSFVTNKNSLFGGSSIGEMSCVSREKLAQHIVVEGYRATKRLVRDDRDGQADLSIDCHDHNSETV